MFAKTIIDSDAFLDMPLSSQALYFHLSMRADDDGFLNNPMKVMRMIGSNKNDYDLLIAKKFIITFDTGVIVIKHWKIHNYIRKDRYNETVYQEEKGMLIEKENGSYSLPESDGIPLVNHTDTQMDTQVRLGKDRLELGKDSIGESIPDGKPSPRAPKHKYGEYKHVLLKDSELEKLNGDFGELETQEAIKCLDEYIEMKGKKYKNHYLVMRKWVFDAVKDKRGGTNGRTGRNPTTPTEVKTDTSYEGIFGN